MNNYPKITQHYAHPAASRTATWTKTQPRYEKCAMMFFFAFVWFVFRRVSCGGRSRRQTCVRIRFSQSFRHVHFGGVAVAALGGCTSSLRLDALYYLLTTRSLGCNYTRRRRRRRRRVRVRSSSPHQQHHDRRVCKHARNARGTCEPCRLCVVIAVAVDVAVAPSRRRGC